MIQNRCQTWSSDDHGTFIIFAAGVSPQTGIWWTNLTTSFDLDKDCDLGE